AAADHRQGTGRRGDGGVRHQPAAGAVDQPAGDGLDPDGGGGGGRYRAADAFGRGAGVRRQLARGDGRALPRDRGERGGGEERRRAGAGGDARRDAGKHPGAEGRQGGGRDRRGGFVQRRVPERAAAGNRTGRSGTAGAPGGRRGDRAQGSAGG